MKLVKAAVASWRVVFGKRAFFDDEWPPRLGAFWAGIQRSCVHATSADSPPFLAEMRAVCARGESALARLRRAVSRKDLPTVGCGLGSFLEDALKLRAVPSMSNRHL